MVFKPIRERERERETTTENRKKQTNNQSKETFKAKTEQREKKNIIFGFSRLYINSNFFFAMILKNIFIFSK
jgi:hypothetical protein